MAIAVNMPQVGQDIKVARIIEWHVKEGDHVSEGDILATVESDKASFEVEAQTDGDVLKILFDKGEEAEVFKPILFLDDGRESSEKLGVAYQQNELPKNGISNNYELILRNPPKTKIFSSPAARRVAREKNVELSFIAGSGPKGRIVKRDVLQYLKKDSGTIKITPLAKRIVEETGVDPGYIMGSGHNQRIIKKDVESIKLFPRSAKLEAQPGDMVIVFDKTRKRIAERLTFSKQTIPHYYVFMEVDMSMALRWRITYNEISGKKVSINDLILKKTAEALAKFPRLNSYVDDDKLVIKPEINIGVAVTTPHGLMVPVIPGADKLTPNEIHNYSVRNSENARRGVINSLVRSTFTVTNLGMYGVSGFIPIINPPECAILSIGALTQKPTVKDGKIEISENLTLGMACDHRAVDGSEASEFLHYLKEIIQNFQIEQE